ncbi:MAG: hypothetical protein NC321_02705 [Clostridium sp.]|nr:hypothetical protein [Clostridium sp.]
MRKHYVVCQIEGEIAKAKADMQRMVNFYYAQNIGKILKKADLSKKEKVEIIEQMERNIKDKIEYEVKEESKC